MEDRETARMRKYGESKTTRIRMATVPHVTSGLGLRKFQADGFLLTRVYQKTWYYKPEDDNYNHTLWWRRQQLLPTCWYPIARLNSVVTWKLHSKLQYFALKTGAEWSSETLVPSVKLHGIITQAKVHESSQTNTMKKEEAFSFVTLTTNYLYRE